MENTEEVFEFLDNDRTSAHFNFVKFTRNEENQDGSIRFRCCKCSITRSSDNANGLFSTGIFSFLPNFVYLQKKNPFVNRKIQSFQISLSTGLVK
ncbi:hypothetical protein BpHYR1_038302 [Brachionus plicatilis]|uniref:Uncharacterized protein n=1 Tax=Brachionus plicatilis TaxID=10195 RepID=A0A3M7SHS8_BRAPC|nr:hypothetical protein BpHYR1_038302 [Brachionus plicatilis]